MDKRERRTVHGGRIAQKGFLYQNSIAATYLFELLIGANYVWSVTCESGEYVDDILVERRRAPTRYYQVKAPSTLGKWTIRRLVDNRIIGSFRKQLHKTAGYCDLILASPLPRSKVSRWAELARNQSSLEQFVRWVVPDIDGPGWQSFVGSLESLEEAYAFLRCYYEERWPESPEDIRDRCLGRHRHSPYASTDGLWHLLRDIAADKATRGQTITRTKLLELLQERSSVFRDHLSSDIDISQIRYTAGPGWYVHRDEEWELLSAVNDFLQGKLRNLIVVGDGGIGKSSFFSWMCRELQKDGRIELIPMIAEGGDPLDFLESLNNALAAKLSSSGPPPGVALSQQDRLSWYIQDAQTRNKLFIIAVDHFEAFFSSVSIIESRNKIIQARYSLFAAIERTLRSRNMMWVLFSRLQHYFLMFPDDYSREWLRMSYVCLTEFSEDQAHQLLSKLVPIAGITLTTDSRRVFIENSGSDPMSLVLSFVHLCSHVRVDEVTAEDILELRPWEDLYRHEFDSLDSIERQVVYAIASLTENTSRRLFSAAEIFDNISLDRPITERDLRDTLHRIQDTKHLLQQPEPEKYALYHEDFGHYVLDQYGGRIRTRESVRRSDVFVEAFVNQANVALQNIISTVENLKLYERREKSDSEALSMLEKVKYFAFSISNQLRTAVLFSLHDDDLAQRMLARERVSLRRVVREVAEHYRLIFDNRAIGLKLELAPDEMSVVGDRGLISAALANVIDNAGRYSFRGQDVIVRSEESSDHWIIEVLDVGIGIGPDEYDMVFEPYYRGNHARMRFPTGSGLGLPVSKRVVESIDGDISIEARPLEGRERTECLVTVRIRFPKWVS